MTVMDVEKSRVIVEKFSEWVPGVANFLSRPEQLIRALHKAWKEQGGTISGKPRHSDRHLTDRLKENGDDIKSLTPKLVGKTRIKPEDAYALVHFFLQNWPKPNDKPYESETDAVKYEALLDDDDINELSGFISDRIGGRSMLPTPIDTPASPASSQSHLPGKALGDIVIRNFEDSDAYFIVSTERPTVAAEPKTELIGFRNLINNLKEIEDADGNERLLVWVLDYGRQSFEDFESRQRYLGVQTLLIRLKALKSFEDRDRESRWKWLESRAVFVVLDPIFQQAIDMKGVSRPVFSAHHVALSALAPDWAKNSEFRALYGSELERLDQRSISVFFKTEGWPQPTDENEDAVIYRRYFGYALFPKEENPKAVNPERVARGLELPSPGENYEDAYRTVYAAAAELLKQKNRSKEEKGRIDGKKAIAQLNYHGFRLLHLSAFMEL